MNGYGQGVERVSEERFPKPELTDRVPHCTRFLLLCSTVQGDAGEALGGTVEGVLSTKDREESEGVISNSSHGMAMD